jgi:tetratricopeptide (TPR) repeat protein
VTPEELFQAGCRLKAAGDFQAALNVLVHAADAFRQQEDEEEACGALAEAADCCRMLDNLDAALELTGDALAVGDGVCSPATICRLKMIRGQTLDDSGKRLEAASILKEAAELAEREVDDPLVRSNAFIVYGDVLYMTNEALAAKVWLQKAVHVACDELVHPETEPGHHRARCNSFVSYGEVLVFLNDEEGIDWLKKAAGLAGDEFCDSHTRCMIWKSYGEALRVMGRMLEARRWLEAAKRVADEQALDSQTRCHLHMLLGQTSGDLKRKDEAIKELGIAVRIADEELDDDHFRCLTLYRYGDAPRSNGAVEDAELQLSKAADLAEQIPDKHTGCAALRSYAELLVSTGRFDEARHQLDKAATLAKDVPDPLLHCNLQASLMNLSTQEQRWDEAWQHARRAQELVLETLGSNRSMRGIAHFLSVYHAIPDVALTAAKELWGREQAGSSGQPTPLDLLVLVDGSKCVAIREGLRRHLGSAGASAPATTVDWHPGPQPWSAAFRPLPGKAARGARQRFRGEMRTGRESPPMQFENPLELPSGIVEKNRYCLPIDEDGLRRVIPEAGMVLLHFAFHGDDLLVFPVHRDQAGALRVLCIGTDHPPCTIKGVREQLRALALRQCNLVYDIQRAILRERNSSDVDAARLFQSGFDLSAVYRDVARVLQLPSVVRRLEDEIGPVESLHLVIVPDGPLFQFPLHALVADEREQRLYEMFASVRYGVSLRTLDLLGTIAPPSFAGHRNAAAGIRGVVFACPGGGLPGAYEEVRELVAATAPDCWRVHGDGDEAEYLATRARFREHHAAGNLLWLIGHGDKYRDVIDGIKVVEPAFRFKDGPLGISRLLHSAHDFSGVELLVVSACWLGAVDAEHGFSREIESYHAALALRGCRRVTSALWPLLDVAAPGFARCFIDALGKHAFDLHPHPPHAFPLAFKQALGAFRAMEGGRFDHEYFWAPYTLYGLG